MSRQHLNLLDLLGNTLHFVINFFSLFIRFGDEIPGMEGLGTGEYNPWNVAFVVFKLLCCVMLNPLLLQTDFFFSHCASSANFFHAQISLWCVHGKRLAIWSCTSSPSMGLFETDYGKMRHLDLFS